MRDLAKRIARLEDIAQTMGEAAQLIDVNARSAVMTQSLVARIRSWLGEFGNAEDRARFEEFLSLWHPNPDRRLLLIPEKALRSADPDARDQLQSKLNQMAERMIADAQAHPDQPVPPPMNVIGWFVYAGLLKSANQASGINPDVREETPTN